jgi:hypothetical protein
MVTSVWSIANLEPKPRQPKLIKLLDSLVLSNQILENWQRLYPAFSRHAGKIRSADYANYISHFNALARHIFAL